MRDFLKFMGIWIATTLLLYASFSFIELSIDFHTWSYASRIIIVLLCYFDMYISGYIVSKL